MKAIILDMYSVIVKQTFPNLNPEEIYKTWNKADMGELPFLEIWAAIGFQGNLEKIEKDYLDLIELCICVRNLI